MSTELEQLLNATAVQPGRPVDLSLVTGRVARRRQTRMTATFAGALAAAAFAFSLVGDTLPTSAPVIGEVPERGESVEGAPTETGETASIEAVDSLDRGSASAESGEGVGADGAGRVVAPRDTEGRAAGEGAQSGSPEDPGWSLAWTFEDGDEGWWHGPAPTQTGRGGQVGCPVESGEHGFAWSAGLGAMQANRLAYDGGPGREPCSDTSASFLATMTQRSLGGESRGDYEVVVDLIADRAISEHVHRITLELRARPVPAESWSGYPPVVLAEAGWMAEDVPNGERVRLRGIWRDVERSCCTAKWIVLRIEQDNDTSTLTAPGWQDGRPLGFWVDAVRIRPLHG